MAQIIILLLLLIFLLVFMFMLFTAAWSLAFYRVPYVATPRHDIVEALRFVNAGPKDIFYELGSGNGRACFIFEEVSGGGQALGFEVTWWVYIFALVKKRWLHSKAQFQRANFLAQPWTVATIIYSYTFPFLMPKIAEKAKRECKPGTRIISRDFRIKTWQPKATIALGHHKIFVYEV